MAYVPNPATETTAQAIKLKTDNLPASPAAVGSEMTLTSAYDSAKTALKTADITVSMADVADNVDIVDVIGNKSDTVSGTSLVAIGKQIKAKTDTLPTNPIGSSDFAVPSQNSSDNVTLRDVIGNKTDDEAGNSLYAALYTVLRHFHSEQKVYPTLASGVTLTGGAGAWELGSFTEIIPASTITNPFDIHFANIGVVSANDTYEVVLYKGALSSEVEIGRFRATRVSNTAGTAPVPVTTPLLPANTRISAKLASGTGGGDTIVMSVFYHTY